MRHQHQHRWLMFLDPDEYLHINKTSFPAQSVEAYVDEWERQVPSVSQVRLQSVTFAGAPNLQQRTLVQQYVWRADRTIAWREKPLVHAASSYSMFAHFATRLRGGETVRASPEVARIHHYMLESIAGDRFHVADVRDKTFPHLTNQQRRPQEEAQKGLEMTIFDDSLSFAAPHIEQRLNEFHQRIRPNYS